MMRIRLLWVLHPVAAPQQPAAAPPTTIDVVAERLEEEEGQIGRRQTAHLSPAVAVLVAGANPGMVAVLGSASPLSPVIYSNGQSWRRCLRRS